ncbi:MAG: RNA methyltransferase [Clostridia bacterium]|nr:RNA methyltransferase [Clostridia bacterium]
MMDTVITSSQNQYVSMARSLSDRKARQKLRLYRIDGVKLLAEAISRGAHIEFLLLSDALAGGVADKANSLYGVDIFSVGARILTVSHSIFEKLSEEQAPEGVITVVGYDSERHRNLEGGDIDLDPCERVLLLESVRDPQNVGAIIRAAAAFSVDRIIMSRDCADIYNQKAVRASMGALFSMKIDRVDHIGGAITAISGADRRVFAAALDKGARRLGSFEMVAGDCVVIGNEGHGLSKEAISACTGSVYIPMSDGVESLNAATAAAVLCWEFFGKH